MRALISCAWAATSMRVRPSARKRRKPGERFSASTNSHHDCFSHCPKRRSSQLVSSTSSRSTKKAWSSGEMPSRVQTVNMNCATAAKSSSEAGACGGGDELVGAVLAREHHPVGGHQLVEDVMAGPRAGDALHRVGQVAVEAREEAEAVLGRQVVAPVGARSAHAVAARLAAEARAALVDGDREAALGQLVRGRQTGDAAPEDRDRAWGMARRYTGSSSTGIPLRIAVPESGSSTSSSVSTLEFVPACSPATAEVRRPAGRGPSRAGSRRRRA